MTEMNTGHLRGRRLLTRLAIAAMVLSIASFSLLAVACRNASFLLFAAQDLGTVLLLVLVCCSGSQVGRWFGVLWLVIKSWVKLLMFSHPERLGPSEVEPAFVLPLQILGVPMALVWFLLALTLAFSPPVSDFLRFRRKQAGRFLDSR